MSKQLAHLHLHTQYSLLDGANKISEILKLAASYGQPAIAMTDHGNLHGAFEFVTEAKKANIKPIVGCELYVTNGSRFEKSAKAGEKPSDGIFHLTVLAKNQEGYKNLCALSTFAYREGFYYKPRVDHELLSRYKDGLIVLSGCLGGEFAHYVALDDRDRAKKLLEFYLATFKDSFYLEIQPHLIPEQQKQNAACIDLAKEMGVPLVATTDCHYPKKEDHFAQEVLMCVSTQKTVTDPGRIKHDGFKLHLKTYEEMLLEFQESKKYLSDSWISESLENTLLIANQCEVKLESKQHFMPRFTPPAGVTLSEHMEEKAREGLKERLEVIRTTDTNFKPSDEQQYAERLSYELGVINNMGFAGYFLVVSDFIIWAKNNGVPVGPGRGSAAGSLVAYSMQITDLDPIRHKLLFERFLNPERVSLPDIDVDFCVNGREQVIKYVIEKYGKENVSQIATFGTMKAKAAIKDVGRALGIPLSETERIASYIPAPRQGFDYSLSESIEMEPRLKEYATGAGKDFITLALKLEGLTRHASTHAAGVVIGDRPLHEILPMMVDKAGNDVTQYAMTYVEKAGLVKFDFLGLKTLSVIKLACDLIKETKNITVPLNRLSLDDPKTYSVLAAGNTVGVFQLESSGITEMTIRLRPSCFDDLVAILALYRPGPLDAGMVDHYIERKHGREKLAYLHPLMKDPLADTYGIMLYQEQIMELSRVLAGYTLGEADILRKAMGKKSPEEMAKQRIIFREGAVKNNITEKIADEIFNQMETFGRYGFNRSHSAAYALISFQTAYLKAHYPVEFMAALMTFEMDDSDKTLKNLNASKKMGIQVLPPDVNISGQGFTPSGSDIRYGLEAIKGIGEKAVKNIITDRKLKGDFTSVHNFLERIDQKSSNKKVLESLIKSGALDTYGYTRNSLLQSIEQLSADASIYKPSAKTDTTVKQRSIFDLAGPPKQVYRKIVNVSEWPQNKKLTFEKETLGFYISGHPLEQFQKDLVKLGVTTISDLKEKAANGAYKPTEFSNGRTRAPVVKLAGVVEALKLKNTKKGDRYASFSFEDVTGTIEALVWPDNYRKIGHLLDSQEPILVLARPDITDERSNIIIEEAESLVSRRDSSSTIGVIVLNENDDIKSKLPEFIEFMKQHPGDCPVKATIKISGDEMTIAVKDSRGDPIRVKPSAEITEQAEMLFGRQVMSFG